MSKTTTIELYETHTYFSMNVLTKLLSKRHAQRKQAGEGYADVDLLDVLLMHEERRGNIPVTEGNII
jgi:hypothetical protein